MSIWYWGEVNFKEVEKKESLYGSLKWEVKLKWHHEDIGYEPNCNEGKREQRRDGQECGRLISGYLCKTK